MSNLDMSSGPQQEAAGTLPNNYSLGGGNMKADPKVPINTVPNPEAGRDDVNTGGRGGDELRQEVHAHVSVPSPAVSCCDATIEASPYSAEMVLTTEPFPFCRTSTFPPTNHTCTPALTRPTSRCTLPSRALTSPGSNRGRCQSNLNHTSCIRNTPHTVLNVFCCASYEACIGYSI